MSQLNADQMVKVYIKIRDAKAELIKEHEAQVTALDAKLAAIEAELLEICKATGQDGGKTAHGSFSRSVKTRYWPSDWGAMHTFIMEHGVPQLLENRIHQGNMKDFLKQHPDLMPVSMNVDSKYSITVRRANNKL